MADKQLTVAELMARAQKENPDAQLRRRRRRSLDEGGVSVAELTGSLKAVDARPAEVKHSSVPIDAEPVKPQAPKVAQEKRAQDTPAQGKPVQDKSEQKASVAGEKSEKSASASRPAAPKPEVKKPAAKSVKVEKADKPEKAEKSGKTEVVQKSQKPAPAKPAAASQKAAAPKAADKADQADKKNAPVSSSFTAVAPQPKQTEQTGPISRVVSFGDAPAKDAEETGEMPVVDKRAARSDLESTQEHPAVRDEPVYENRTDEVEVDNSVNPILLVLLVFAGLVVGVLVFLGFQYLWSELNPFLTGVLALVVTGGAVLLVRAMKTGRDALTMTLAAIAGAAMTFGPALVALA